LKEKTYKDENVKMEDSEKTQNEENIEKENTGNE
jgi:hypothetical protein